MNETHIWQPAGCIIVSCHKYQEQQDACAVRTATVTKLQLSVHIMVWCVAHPGVSCNLIYVSALVTM